MPEHRGTLAEYLDRALLKRGWSKADLARESGVSESMVGRYLGARGGTHTPTVDNARLLAAALGVPLKKFVVDVGLFTAEELDAEIPAPPSKAPADMSDDELAAVLEEASRRFKGKAGQRRPPTAADIEAQPERFVVVDPGKKDHREPGRTRRRPS
jgi:transcriptional regulator with XRE-family HTH domain